MKWQKSGNYWFLAIGDIDILDSDAEFIAFVNEGSWGIYRNKVNYTDIIWFQNKGTVTNTMQYILEAFS